MKALLVVFFGSGLGGVTRYYASEILNSKSNYAFPLGTFIINILACLILGCLIGYGGKLEFNTRLLLASGFCGGFSTFSAFSGETLLLLQKGQYGLAAGYVVGSILVCLAATCLGYWMGTSI